MARQNSIAPRKNLTPLQYALLTEIITEHGGRVTLEWIAHKKQGTFGSFMRRGFLEYVPGKTQMVQTTEDALSAVEAYNTADTNRRIESSILSVYFYRKTGLKPPKVAVSSKTQAVLAVLKGGRR